MNPENSISAHNLNPLLISPIINKVFHHLPSLHFLKHCRLVCKTWERETRGILRQKGKVNLTKFLNSLKARGQSSSSSIIKEELAILARMTKICPNLILDQQNPDVLKDYLISSIMETNIIYLEIKGWRWSYSQVDNILMEMKSLEELRIPILCYMDDNEAKDLFVPYPSLKRFIVTLNLDEILLFKHGRASIRPILRILERCPSLEEFYYPNVMPFTNPMNNPARTIFERIIYNRDDELISKNLSVLKIDTFLSNEDLRLLAMKKVAFKELQFTISPEVRCDCLYEFLKCSENSLKKLTLTFRDGFHLTSEFPKMPELTQLTIILWNGNLDFLENIQAFKTLVIPLVEYEEGQPHFTNQKTLKTLEKFELYQNSEEKNGIVQDILDMLPCTLKSLTVDWVTDSFLQQIYKGFTAIETLTITCGGFSDAGITGIPLTFCRLNDNCEIEDLKKLKKRLAIHDLASLKMLSITGELSDFSLIFGISKCHNLRNLFMIVKNGRRTRVTDKGVRSLAEKDKQLDHVVLKGFHGITDEGKTYMRNKMQKCDLHFY